MRQSEEFFPADQELELIYIAKRLKEALKLEELLTRSGVDYLVEPDTYRGGIIFPAERVGAFFYIVPAHLSTVHELMRENGYKPYDVTHAR